MHSQLSRGAFLFRNEMIKKINHSEAKSIHGASKTHYLMLSKTPCEIETLRDRISPDLTVTAVKSFAQGAIQHTSSIHVRWSAALCQGIVLAMEGNERGETHLWMLIRKKEERKGSPFLCFCFCNAFRSQSGSQPGKIQHIVWKLRDRRKRTCVYISLCSSLCKDFKKKATFSFQILNKCPVKFPLENQRLVHDDDWRTVTDSCLSLRPRHHHTIHHFLKPRQSERMKGPQSVVSQ